METMQMLATLEECIDLKTDSNSFFQSEFKQKKNQQRLAEIYL